MKNDKNAKFRNNSINPEISLISKEGLSQTVEKYIKNYFAMHGDELPPPNLYKRILKEIERPLLSVTLNATQGNQIKAANILGLNRNTLRKKLKDHQIK